MAITFSYERVKKIKTKISHERPDFKQNYSGYVEFQKNMEHTTVLVAQLNVFGTANTEP